MTWVFVEPKDVWLFRNGKPFSSGEDHSATSLFPPTPLTVQGAMRAKISMSLGVSLGEYRSGKSEKAQQARAYIGPPGAKVETGQFEMQGPFIGVCVDGIVHQLLPTPLDLYKFDEKYTEDEKIPDNLKDCIDPEKKPMFRIASLEREPISDLDASDLQMPGIYRSYESISNYWLTADAFTNYLNGIAPTTEQLADDSKSQQDDDISPVNLARKIREGKHVLPRSILYRTEGRFGVATDAMTSFRDEGQLYQAQFIRMSNDAGLLVNVDNIPESNLLEGTLTLGGEQREALASTPETNTITPNPEKTSGKFKIVLLTPAYFDGGWQPHNGFTELLGDECTLSGAALGRPLRIGGWSSSGKGGARPMHNYVAAGSVYYFNSGDAEISLPSVFTQSPSSIDDAGKIGFGQFAVTKW